MGHIINYNDVVGRYEELSKAGGSTDLDKGYVIPAEAYIESRLGIKYTTPFSSNNLTAKDLAIDETYRRIMLTRQPKKAETIGQFVKQRIDELLNGQLDMQVESGSAVAATETTIWSSTKDYHPVFGMGDTLDFVVDSSQITDETDARS